MVGFLFLCALGNWQLNRRAEAATTTEALSAQIALAPVDVADAPPDTSWRRASATGTPDWDHYILVSGKYMWGQAGSRLLVPLEFQPGGHVLVDVGWIPADEVDLIVANERAEGTTRSYTGLARVFPEDPDPRGEFPLEGYQRRWRAVDVPAMAEAVGKPLLPWVLVEGEGVEPAGAIVDRRPPISGWLTRPEERPHGQYAFTWFGLAGTLVAVWLSLSFQRLPVTEAPSTANSPGPPLDPRP